MDISSNLATALGMLTEARDDHLGTDIAATLLQVADEAAAAVPSYLGLTVMQRGAAPPFTITAMEVGADPAKVRSSLRLPLQEGGSLALTLILYAAGVNAFADLAADLAWVLGRPLTGFALNENLRPPPEPDVGRSVHVMSVINQAIGVLIGRGYRPERADDELTARADRAGDTRYDAARAVLRSLTGGPGDQPPDVW